MYVFSLRDTPDVGSDEYNDKLSLSRANAAKTYLVNAGIDERRIKTAGLGKRHPLVKGTSDEARATNRRVEMKITK
jgi:OmpA-OmpF porin, OOP family